MNENWHAFDIAIVVVDGRQGVNTEEQLDILKLAKNNVESKKEIPVILLLNKVDDPHGEEQRHLLGEFRASTEELFGVSDRLESLEDLLRWAGKHTSNTVHSPSSAGPAFSYQRQDAPFPAPASGFTFGSSSAPAPAFSLGVSPKNPSKPKVSSGSKWSPGSSSSPLQSHSWSFSGRTSFFPVVIPICAMHAFLYRCGARLTFETFCNMDWDFIDKIGKESYGRQWYRFSKDEQLKKAFNAVSDEEQCMDGVAASNFETFLKVLRFCIGDGANQLRLLKAQIQVYSDLQSKGKGDLAKHFGHLYILNSILSGETTAFTASFWKGYKIMSKEKFGLFCKNETIDPALLSGLPKQLWAYLEQLKRFRHFNEKDKFLLEAKRLLNNYFSNVRYLLTTKGGSTFDIAVAFSSILLNSSNSVFCYEFGNWKINLELTLQQ